MKFSRYYDLYFVSQGSGTAYGSATSRLPLVNRGAGYDATDSFIDDTEAVSFI